MSDPSARDRARPLLRLGWLAKGALFVIIGLLSVELARQGFVSEDADQKGALEALSSGPIGRIAVFAVSIGLLLYSIWQGWSAVTQHRSGDDTAGEAIHQLKRIGWVGLAALYALLASTGLTIAIRGERAAQDDGGGPTSAAGLTRRLFEWPGGRGVVTIIGIATIAVGLYQLWKAVRRDFLDDIDTSGLGSIRLRVFAVLGAAGFLARALLMATAGWLFIDAALIRNPDRAAGLDDSLRILSFAPGGQVLLAATGIGLIAAGTYDMVTFRRQRIEEA